ncbi:MAG: hypothetical protein Q9169_008255 [Polycauliona sp. 2 TL-2023]
MDLLRSYLQPLTHNLPTPLAHLLSTLLTPTCYNQLILRLDLSPSSPCLSLAISKLLGLGIITLSSVVKIPQIINLLNAKSGKGISLLSYLLETASYLVTLVYGIRMGFPFTAFGETALISIQNLIICVLVFVFSGRTVAASVFVGAVGVGVWALLDKGVVGMEMLGWMQAGAGAVGVASKGPQIWANWERGGTGVLSAFTVFTYLAGSLSRIFTTIQEVDDKLILYGFVAGFALNAVLAAQMVLYWQAPGKGKGKGGEEKKMMMEREMDVGESESTGVKGREKGKGTSTRRRG